MRGTADAYLDLLNNNETASEISIFLSNQLETIYTIEE